jgi:hypothetical protein
MAVAIAVLVFANGATAAIPMRAAVTWPAALDIAVPGAADAIDSRSPAGSTWHTFELVTIEDATRATYRECATASLPVARPARR